MNEQEREFKGVWIPREIWLDERLNALDKVILVEIDSLDNGDKHCCAGNDYLAKFCQCSESKISRAISKLVELKYIKVHSFDGRMRKLQSCLSFSTIQSRQIAEAASQNVPPIIISNNTYNNIDNKSISTKHKTKNLYTDGFDEFYSIYPRPVVKSTALAAWSKLKPNEDLKRTIISDVKRRIDGEWKEREEKYIPYPSTYLNQRRWEDGNNVNQRPQVISQSPKDTFGINKNDEPRRVGNGTVI